MSPGNCHLGILSSHGYWEITTRNPAFASDCGAYAVVYGASLMNTSLGGAERKTIGYRFPDWKPTGLIIMPSHFEPYLLVHSIRSTLPSRMLRYSGFRSVRSSACFVR